MKPLQTRKIPRERYRDYWTKATEFIHGALQAETEGHFNLAALNAIHAAISTVDAVTTFTMGERSASQNHADASLLLKRTALPGVSDRTVQFTTLIQHKNKIEYDADEPTDEQASHMVLQAKRLYDWAKTIVEKK